MEPRTVGDTSVTSEFCTIPATLVEGKTYQLGACVAPTSGESDSDNNCMLGAAVFTHMLDMVVESIAVSPATVEAGQQLTLSVRYGNVGTVTATRVVLSYILSTDPAIDASALQTSWTDHRRRCGAMLHYDLRGVRLIPSIGLASVPIAVATLSWQHLLHRCLHQGRRRPGGIE